MQLKFQIKEPGNFFHILDSLSQWDIHTRKTIHNYYIENFPLNKNDFILINKYIEIRKKYPWGDLDSDFYIPKSFKEVERRLNKRLSKKELKKMKEIIKNFRRKMHPLFIRWKPFLEKRKKNLEKNINKYQIKNILLDIANFYGVKKIPKKVTIHLLLNPSEAVSGGGANIWPKEHITLEPKNLKFSDEYLLKQDISIILHETLHLIEYNSSKANKELLRKVLDKNKINREIFREAIADTLVPDGYLALKYRLLHKIPILEFKNIKLPDKKDKRFYFRQARHKLSSLFYPISIKQIESKKSILNKEFLDKYIAIYKKVK